ncbi:MAG: hypothetical protein RLZZ297_1246 [Chloroflexota bacterium]
MGRMNSFVVIVVLLLTLVGGAVLGAVAGAGASIYLIQKRLSQPVTVVATPEAVADAPTAAPVPPTALPAAPTALPPTPAQAAAPASEDIPTMIARVGDAVVTVLNYSNPNEVVETSSGSGAFISPDGYIVTNNHVIADANRLQVVYADGSTHEARLIGTDPLNDIAVIKTDDPVPAVMTLGDSDALRQGETVVAIGNPLGDYRNTVTVGVVSGLNRNLGSDAPEGLIQTDAAINHGNSGGPLLNARGEIIGLNTLVVRGAGMGTADTAEGLGFAVPANIVRKVAEQLISHGEVRYPFMGITYGMVNEAIVAQYNLPVKQGAYVSGVTDGGPAQQAGIMPGDVIVTLDGIKLGETDSLRGVLLRHNPGDTVSVTVVRGTEEKTFDVTLVVRPTN